MRYEMEFIGDGNEPTERVTLTFSAVLESVCNEHIGKKRIKFVGWRLED